MAQPKNRREYLTTTPVPKLILSMSVPTIISMMVTAIYNTADTFFVARVSDNPTVNTNASVFATGSTEIQWQTYADKNISGNITLNCYPLTTDQFNVLCQTTSGQDHDDAVKSVLSNPPLYTGSSNFDTKSNETNPVVRIPLTKRGS